MDRTPSLTDPALPRCPLSLGTSEGGLLQSTAEGAPR
jgi:hypothetical protein